MGSVKRSLKNSEIEYIIEFMKPNPSIPKDISTAIITRNRERVIAQLKAIKIYPEMIEDLKRTLFKQYHMTICPPGESVGIITAQSIGERQTQNTLNSVVYDEKILLQGGSNLVIRIGELIDYLMNKNNHVEKYENGQEYLDIQTMNYRVPSVDENGRTSWERVLAVTRHPGEIIQVKTRSGRTVTASTGKSFLVKSGDVFVPTDGSDLRIGDQVPVVMNFPEPIKRITTFYDFPLNKGFAAFIANCILNCYNIEGDELLIPNIMNDYEFHNDLLNFIAEHSEYVVNDYIFRIRSEKLCSFVRTYCRRSIPDFVFTADRVFMKNLVIVIKTIYGNRFVKDQDFAERYLHLLSQVDGLYRKTECGSMNIFEKIRDIHLMNDVHLDEVVEIQKREMTHPYLYDLTVENTKNFVLFSGIGVRDTFHNTGLVVKTVVTGVPRFSELINATHEPKAPSCSVFFNKNTDSISNLKAMINHSIREITFGDLIKGNKCGKNLPKKDWYKEYELLYGDEHLKFEWSIQVKLDVEMLFDYRITLNKITKRLMGEYTDIVCIFSPEHIGEIHIFVDVSKIENDDELYEDIEDAYSAYVEEIALQSVKTVQLFGIKGVKNIFYEKKGTEWMMDTEGSNFQEILSHPAVDKVRTVSNNMWEIYETLGIEAARNFLIEEFAAIVSSDGTFVNDSHIMLLVDIMTFSGSIISISRYGMKKENCGPMAKASFEESLDNFLKAGAFGEKESTNGVSASIMLGKLAKFGTGICDVLVDINRLPDKPVVIKSQVVEKEVAAKPKRSPKIVGKVVF